MSNELNPAILGQKVSDEMTNANLLFDFHGNQSDIEEALVEVETTAHKRGYLSKDYFVTTARAFAIPRITEEFEETSSWGMERLSFRGNLVTYSMVKVGHFIGGNAIRAVCLTFDDAVLLPTFDRVRPRDQLHVPVFAVSEIDVMN